MHFRAIVKSARVKVPRVNARIDLDGTKGNWPLVVTFCFHTKHTNNMKRNNHNYVSFFLTLLYPRTSYGDISGIKIHLNWTLNAPQAYNSEDTMMTDDSSWRFVFIFNISTTRKRTIIIRYFLFAITSPHKLLWRHQWYQN